MLLRLKINNGKSHLKWSRKARRGSPLALPLDQLGSIIDPKRKASIRDLNRKRHLASWHYFTTPARGRRISFLVQQLSRWETVSTLNSLFPPVNFLVKHPLPTPTFFVYKIHPSSLLVGLACGFAIACLSWIAVLCYSGINSFYW